jgi:tRNA (guanine37-N1)-methyltransferase
MPTMRLDIITLFPEVCAPYLGTSVLGRAQSQGQVEVRLVQLRDFTDDRHRTVDDTPFGGGRGMVLKPEPVVRAIRATRPPDGHVVLLTPQGTVFDQETARRLSRLPHLVLVAGHYEGFDERVRNFVDEELSIGDFVLTGGELAALVVADATLRLVPGVLPAGAADDDSFSEGLLEYPHYTRPRVFEGMAVPEVLLSGDHAAIARWRRQERLRRTLERRPDLILKAHLTPDDLLFVRTWKLANMGKEEMASEGREDRTDRA